MNLKKTCWGLFLFFSFLLLGSMSHAQAPALVQANGNNYTNCITVSSCMYTLSSNVASGDALVVGVDTNGNGSVSLGGSGAGCSSTSWTAIGSADGVGGPLESGFVGVASGSGACTVTATIGSVSNVGIVTLEYSGATATPIDTTACPLPTGCASSMQTDMPSLSSAGGTTLNSSRAVIIWSDGNQSSSASASGWTSEVNQAYSGSFDEAVASSGTTVSFAGMNFVLAHYASLVMVVLKSSNPAGGGGGGNPTISSLNPTSGPIGTLVNISGSNFGATQSSSAITFNGTNAGTAPSWSTGSIQINVPSGATTGNVVVTVGGHASNGVNFTVTSSGGGGGGGGIALGPPGWHDLTNTKLTSFCYGSTFGSCANVENAWSSAAADTLRNRLIIWGGGHGDYAGNEVYALDLATSPPQMVRLDAPSTPYATCMAGLDALADGRPSARHTYDQLGYLPDQDEFISVGGGGVPTPCDGGTTHTWLLAMNSVVDSCAPSCTSAWTDLGTVGYSGPGYNMQSAYDSARHLFWIFDSVNLWNFDPATNTMTKAGQNIANTGIYSIAVHDPVDQYLIVAGQDNASQNMTLFYISTAPGSTFLVNQPSIDASCSGILPTGYVGMTWDPVEKRVVLFPNNGSSIWVLDPHIWKCYQESYGNTQNIGASSNGNFKRFNYFPALDVFAMCNDPTNDCWYLRRRR